MPKTTGIERIPREKDDTVKHIIRQMGRYPVLRDADHIELSRRIQAWLAPESDPEMAELIKKICASGSLYKKSTHALAAYHKAGKTLGRKLPDDVVKAGLAARDKMVRHNQRLVFHEALKYCTTNKPGFVDCFQNGMIGLQRAAEKFDYRRGFSFSTYATPWIKQMISRGLGALESDIAIPFNLREHRYQLIKRVKKCQQEGMSEYQAYSAAMRTFPGHIQELLKKSSIAKSTLSIDKPVRNWGGDSSRDVSLKDIIPAHENTQAEVMQAEAIEKVREALSTLTPRQRKILIEREVIQGRTMKALAKELGCSSTHAQAMKLRAIAKIRANFPELKELIPN